MKFYSELTKKVYDTHEAVEAAEQEIKEREAAKQKLAEKRADRAKEVEDAYKAIITAQKHYQELVNQFIKDYGSFHMTYKDEDVPSLFDLFDIIFK